MAQYCVGCAIVMLCACSRRDRSGHATGGPTSSASSAVTAARESAPRFSCKSGATAFSLGPVEAMRQGAGESAGDSDPEGPAEKGPAENGSTESESDAPEDLPFGVSVGMALGHAAGFVVSAVDARRGTNHAVLALLDSEVAKGRVLDLGRVYGDAEPPRMVQLGDSLFVVVPDTDASGNSYRYGWVRGLETATRIDWLGSFETSVDDSAVFSLGATQATITVAWDEVEQKSHQSFVRWASLDAQGRIIADATARTGQKRSAKSGWTVSSTSSDVDAEAPQLVTHGSGYWLAYLAAERPKSDSAKLGVAPARPAPQGDESGTDGLRAVDLGRRGIALLALDGNGRAQSKPIWITDRAAHVLTFDIEALPDGGALVAYRDADTTPGVEAQVVELARVRPDGGVEHRRIDDERIGAGMPTLLADSAFQGPVTSTPNAWLSVAGTAGETRLAELPDRGPPNIDLFEESRLMGVEPLLRFGNSLLVARHRARFVEFERVQCVWSGGPMASGKLP